MRILCLLTISICGLSVAHYHHVIGDLDDNDNLNEEEFEYHFGKEKILDPAERTKRQKSLSENEQIVKEENEAFIDGKKGWYAKIYSFDDETEEEILNEKTGGKMPTFSRGLGGLLPPENERRDNRSERYFERMSKNRATVPESYSAVDKGIVSPIKTQKNCGSCVAFATIAVVETCFKKLTGEVGDYSEQELVDCGYGQYGAMACNGAYFHSYSEWITVNKRKLTSEAKYPYLNTKPNLWCPKNVEPYNQGAIVSDQFYTYAGDEDKLKQLVSEKGAVVAGVYTDKEFNNYGGGIFDSCFSQEVNHAIAVVGYGTENGVDYWLIKNSWGADWGEQGFMKLKRGVEMCGIGRILVTVDCKTEEGPTDATVTEAPGPCEDKIYCDEVALDNCFGWAKDCPKSCGLCDGMTPHPSMTCFNKFSNCADLCACPRLKSYCKKACGTCNGDPTLQPASTICKDSWKSCPEYKDFYCGKTGDKEYKPLYTQHCKKTCGLCK